jgi:hypothetical protein
MLRNKLQSRSSTEAEYKALANAMTELILVQSILDSWVFLEQNLIFSSVTTFLLHICQLIRFSFLHQTYKSGLYIILFVNRLLTSNFKFGTSDHIHLGPDC